MIVANRLPVSAKKVGATWRTVPGQGGLVAGLGPVMRRHRGIWIGRPEDGPDDPARRELIEGWKAAHGHVAVDLPPSVSRAFYDGYSNDTLWPLLHGFPSRVRFDPETWHAYRDTNDRFAQMVLDDWRVRDLVWVHDYQLMLVPDRIREAQPGARVGFYLHVPFPPAAIFRILPDRESVLRGLLGADYLGFQTHADLHAFRHTLLEVLGIESGMDRVDLGERTVRLAALPIGVVAEDWELLQSDPAVAERVRDLKRSYRDGKLVLAVDRLDYTKGIPERLRAFRRLLRASGEWRRRVTLLQLAVPTRERVPQYRALRREVSELVGEINGEFGTADWTPVVYLHRTVPRGELAALYAAADVAWVTPLRDGMNLVAKEYIACQTEGDGVLVISEFAGAAQEMGEAIRVNPYDEVGMADSLRRALEMDAQERRERMAALSARTRANSSYAWADRFIDGLTRASEARSAAMASGPEPLAVGSLVDGWRRAATRRLYVDYDGTLVPLASLPREAAPAEELVETLGRLAAQPGVEVVLVSGRPRADVDRWFGAIGGLWIAAEHGGLLRAPGGGWRTLRIGADAGWKGGVRPVLEHFAAQAPGSLVEEKEYSIAWHYRAADPEFGTALANELVGTLSRQLAGTELAVLKGSKVVEVRFAWANKGEVVRFIDAVRPAPEIQVAMGDDRTDEDLFRRLGGESWTIKVGPGPSAARHRLPSPVEARGLLAALAARDGDRDAEAGVGTSETELDDRVPQEVSGPA